MTTLFRGLGRPVAVRTAAAAFTLGLAAAALVFSSPARAATSSCNDPVISAPTGPATVSAASTEFGRVLVVGSGADAGCSLYLLTSDQLHSLTGANFACGDTSLLGGRLATRSSGPRSSPSVLLSRARGSTPRCSGR
jgi:hypothetical protein